MPSFGLPSARAEASRRNGAKSKGPKTPEGKARSAQNALKHGLRAQKQIVLPGEDAAEYQALEAALMEELAPEGVLQRVLAQRVVAAAWRLERAERIEAELFEREMYDLFGDGGPGLALIRDCNGPRAFDTLLRYRGGTLAELWRALRTLKALQAEAREVRSEPAAPESRVTCRSPMRHKSVGNASLLRLAEPHETPIEPESRGNPRDSGRPDERADLRDSRPASALLPPRSPATSPGPARCAQPIEPERRRNPGESAPRPAGEIAKDGSTSLLAGTALVPPRRFSCPFVVGVDGVDP